MKVKRLLALILTLVLAMAIIAIPVSAATYDPRTCPNCHSSDNVGIYSYATSWTTYNNNTCGHGTGGVDLKQMGPCVLRCYSDGTSISSIQYSVFCPGSNSRYY